MAIIKSKFLFFLCLLAFALFGASNAADTKKTVGVFELKKGNFTVKVTNFGATIMSVILPDSQGNLADIVLGYDTPEEYANGTFFFGALVGRVANRIANAQFTLDNKTYHLPANDGQNSLHGGIKGFSHLVWTVKESVGGEHPYITFYRRSVDGEQGYPGDLDVFVTYKLSGDYEFTVDMTAKPVNKATPVNLAQHTYWNLAGEGSGTILSNTVQISASHITPVDSQLIPTGELLPVKGTSFDFEEPMNVGSRIGQVGGGYDINYALNSPVQCNGLRKVAVVTDCKTGRTMELSSNQVGVQFYTSNFLTNWKGKNGHQYPKYSGIALETQGFPNSVNQLSFPSQIVTPGEIYKHIMVYSFSF
ncbi:galactose mutarotase-like [Dioscorea cayenensis subsp. rotundata]|uniref:Aldose 1-epimerase n=1 Tax=Dioscorea cayennensis subsp. rotundata TaxID=55577 RepID=A0AB40D0G6_DIOCR|nr:galactose mutarotase-like [Dioscorea cayenensis subsp. rotundata]